MFGQGRGRTVAALTAAVIAATGLAACGGGGSSGSPAAILSQTFSASRQVQSGNLSFALTLTPTGSSTITGPITLSFGGPFQSLGKGKLPASDFSVTVSGLGNSVKLGLVSTGTQGFVMLDGTAYQLPASSFQQLESGFSGIGGGSGGFGNLGIDPQKWLSHPSVAGHDMLDGTDTTHVRAAVNVAALLADLNTLLQKASASGISAASKLPTLSPATQRQIAAEITNPTVDIWTGTGDKLLRKLSVVLTLPVTGQTATQLGGLTSALINITLSYTGVNQRQTITAPATSLPYSQFQQKIQSVVNQLGSSLGSTGATGMTGAAGSTGATGSTGAAGTVPGATTTPGSTSNITKYAQCIQAANGDVTKMQQCATLLTKK